MQYVVSTQWPLMPSFAITDASGNPAFEARRDNPRLISLLDQSGRAVVAIQWFSNTYAYDIWQGGNRVATVHHARLSGKRCDVDSPGGGMVATGRIDGGDYILGRKKGPALAQVQRQPAEQQNFTIIVADGQNDAFLLAVTLAIEGIYARRHLARHDGSVPIPDVPGFDP
jgi:hypothetical protein